MAHAYRGPPLRGLGKGDKLDQAAPAEADSVAMDVEAVALFRKMDINGDGVLDLSELRAGMADSGMLDTEIEALFLSLDFITDNKVSV